MYWMRNLCFSVLNYIWPLIGLICIHFSLSAFAFPVYLSFAACICLSVCRSVCVHALLCACLERCALCVCVRVLNKHWIYSWVSCERCLTYSSLQIHFAPRVHPGQALHFARILSFLMAMYNTYRAIVLNWVELLQKAVLSLCFAVPTSCIEGGGLHTTNSARRSRKMSAELIGRTKKADTAATARDEA